MKMMRFLLDFIFMIIILIVEFELKRVVAQNCDNQTVQLCLSDLSNNGLDIKHIDDDLPTWNETSSMLSRRCGAFHDFSQCMSDEVDRCVSKERDLYSGWIEAYNFLCKQSNLTDVAEYLKCFVSPAVNWSAEYVCRRTFTVKVSILTNGSSTITSDLLADYCTLADSFFVCLNNTLTSNCDEEAAKWQWTWDQKLNGALIASCEALASGGSSDDQGNNSWTVALIVVLVVIAFVIVLGIVVLIIFLCRKKKESSRTQQVRRRTHTAAGQPPPPYSAVLYSSSEPGTEPQAHLVDSSVTITTSHQEGQESAVHPPTDVFLPPPYMGERPPAPDYEATQEANASEQRQTEAEEEREREREREEETRNEADDSGPTDSREQENATIG